MPKDTLHYACQLADEWQALRTQVHEKDMLPEALIDAEARYLDVIDTMAEDERILAALPDFMPDLIPDLILSTDTPSHAVFAHLLLRTLQTDWRQQWFDKIASQSLPVETLTLCGFLPQPLLIDVLKTARQHGGLVRQWAASMVSRYHIVALSHGWHEGDGSDSESDGEGLNTNEVAWLLGQFASPEHKTRLQEQLTHSGALSLAKPSLEASTLNVHCAVALLMCQDTQGLTYLRQNDIIISEAAGYGKWLATYGTQQDLRLIEKAVLTHLHTTQIDVDITPVLAALDVLSQYGDALTAKWLYDNLLLQDDVQLRIAGFEAMLPLFDPDMVETGYQLINQSSHEDQQEIEPSDENGEDKESQNEISQNKTDTTLTGNTCQLYWDNVQKKFSRKTQILPGGRCRAGQAYDQLADFTTQLEYLPFGDINTADNIRIGFAIISHQHLPLDAYAPYTVFDTQRSAFIQAIAQFKQDSHYIAGSFMQWNEVSAEQG